MYPLLPDLTIIEASSFVASPSAGLYMAQMGAQVIRVDQIGGGPDYRRWPLGPNGDSLYWENLNRAKTSLALDLKSAEGRELLVELVRATGQFITNYPVDGFLSYAALAQARTDLVTVRIMGQADGGSALDYTVNCAVGIPDMTGTGTNPINHVLPAWDLLTGAYAAFAMLAALRHRDATGAGQEVRIPLQDVATASVANLGMIAEVLVGGHNRERLGNAVYGAFGRDFVTRDGRRLMIMAITSKQWAGLVAALDMAGEVAQIETQLVLSFADDEGLRFAHRDRLFPLVEGRVAQWDYPALAIALDAHVCCYGPYQTMLEAAQDPKLVTHNPIFSRTSNPSGMAYPAAGAFATIPQMPREAARAAPAIGAHSEQILATHLGLSSAQIGALIDKGIVSQS
ncbi:MAG: CoA transferase [Sphingopyxis sp.]